MRSIEEYHPELKVQPWGTETLIGEGPGYTMKLLLYNAGYAGGLQYHRKKHETFYLAKGQAKVRYDDGSGKLVEEIMRQGQSFCIPPGAPHQFYAITDCVVFEASTPGTNDRVNVAEKYGRERMEYDLPTTYSEKEIGDFERGLNEYPA